MTEVILVTGSPRSGTTPVGDILACLPRTATLYEPMGPTGDQRFAARFPMVGADGLTDAGLAAFIADLAAGRLHLKPQDRPSGGVREKTIRRLIGSRTALSLRLYRANPFARRLIWKDPHAVFCATAVAALGVKTVVTMRPPLAQAASFKRLGWVSQAGEVQRRLARAGELDAAIDALIERHGGDPVGSAAILWHLAYRRFAGAPGENLRLFDLAALGEDEAAGYADLFQWLGQPMPAKAMRRIARRSGQDARPKPGQVHDFARSARSANAYWSDVLTADEIALVEDLNGALWDRLRAQAASQRDRSSP